MRHRTCVDLPAAGAYIQLKHRSHEPIDMLPSATGSLTVGKAESHRILSERFGVRGIESWRVDEEALHGK
jgi:hypothetical protein